ncbi:hypothetical protein BgiBS90_030097, partial [Biomphalaria glabrata]
GKFEGRNGKGRPCPCKERRADKAEETLTSLYFSGCLLYVYRVIGNVMASSPAHLNVKIGEYCLSRFPLGL